MYPSTILKYLGYFAGGGEACRVVKSSLCGFGFGCWSWAVSFRNQIFYLEESMFKYSPQWLACFRFVSESSSWKILKDIFPPSWAQAMWIVCNLNSKVKIGICRDRQTLDSFFSISYCIWLCICPFIRQIFLEHLLCVPDIELPPGDSSMG